MNWKSLLSVVFTILLLIVLFHFYPFEDFVEKFVHLKPVQVLIILGAGVLFLLTTGIELYFYYRIYAGRNISLYDVVTLPVVMNLWGHVLPFQGSFIYNAVYLKSKYGISVGSNIKVYLFQFICSISIGVFMLFLYKINNNTIIPIEYLLYPIIILAPFFYNRLWVFMQVYIQKFLPERFKTSNAAFSVLENKKVFWLIFINLVVSVVYGFWLYSIATILNFNITIPELIIAGILSKVALLFRFTPGNIGINQFTFGGIFVILGLAASQGIIISLYVSATLFFTSFTLGIIFHIINLKYISLNKLLPNEQ